MGTLTAQILVGRGHTNHDGINPTHYMFLSENSRPAWTLTGQNIFDDQEPVGRFIWIPSAPETILDDALLMIAVHVSRDENIVKIFHQSIKNSKSDYVDLGELNGKPDQQKLYELCRKIEDFPKLIISVFESSSVGSQLHLLQNYKMDVEVCAPTYSRIYSEWEEKTIVEGSLDF